MNVEFNVYIVAGWGGRVSNDWTLTMTTQYHIVGIKKKNNIVSCGEKGNWGLEGIYNSDEETKASDCEKTVMQILCGLLTVY